MSMVIGFVIAAALGAFLRWGLYLVPHPWESHTHPWATFVVNFLGSMLMGFLFLYLEKFPPQVKAWICVAFLGAFTTYSSFSLDMVRLLDEGSFKLAVLYFLCTNLFCISGCYIGWFFAKNLVTTA